LKLFCVFNRIIDRELEYRRIKYTKKESRSGTSMKPISAEAINQEYACPPPMPTMEEVEKEMQEYDWEKATALVAFHTSSQYIGPDGRHYQMTAEYADDADKVFPIVRVTMTDDSGSVSEYSIDITKIDTARATEVEMFALCSHEDTKRGRYIDNSANISGTWESLLFYRDMAVQKGYNRQGNSVYICGEKTYNWRDMVSSVAEACMDDEAYDSYLQVNRMKDLLEYHSRFEDRPVAFHNPFSAIREYEFVGILSLDNGINIELYDKQKKIVCKNYNLEWGMDTLWGAELTDEEFEKALEVIQSPYRAYMGDYSFWKEILSGSRQLEDYGGCFRELLRQYRNDSMFVNCPSKVKEAWKQAENRVDLQALGLKEVVIPEIGLMKGNMEMEFISEYTRLLMERMRSGKATDLLGTTVESAIDMARQAISRLEEMDLSQMTAKDRRFKLKERTFYYRFLEYLDPTQKYDPIQSLLKR